MLRVGIIGGETHAGAIIQQHGKTLEIVQAAVRADQVAWAQELLKCDVITDADALLARDDLDVVFVANENDRRWDVIEATLRSGRWEHRDGRGPANASRHVRIRLSRDRRGHRRVRRSVVRR